MHVQQICSAGGFIRTVKRGFIPLWRSKFALAVAIWLYDIDTQIQLTLYYLFQTVGLILTTKFIYRNLDILNVY